MREQLERSGVVRSYRSTMITQRHLF